jgi:predicted dehydrogenase
VTYEAFRLGMTFAEVRRMMWNHVDPNRPGWWRQKRRHCVLGFMRELKIHSFYATHRYCEDAMEVAA